jgi:transcription initiation factor IIE alpha subunit
MPSSKLGFALEDLEEEKGFVCVACQEGYSFKPQARFVLSFSC